MRKGDRELVGGRSKMNNKNQKQNITQTELIWSGKYDEQGNKKKVEKIVLPFQSVETVNEPREKDLFHLPNWWPEGWYNRLIWGDNKYIMASLLPEFAGKINLIYIDPPFATGADFSINIKLGDLEWTKEASVIEEKAYRDTWGRGVDSYLQMMYERLILMRELLADNGSIYVHLDWHVGHYVKIIMDEIFGKENFRNEVIWQKLTTPKAQTLGFGNVHDVILWFSKNTEIIFNEIKIAHKEDYLEKMYRFVEPETGRRYRLHDFTQKGQGEVRRFGKKVLAPPPGKHWIWSQERIDGALKKGMIVFSKTGMPQIKRYLDEVEGQRLHDIWTDVSPIGSVAQERLDYPTQKPKDLLERIIKASSNEGDLVADFFCGSGTTGAVAEELGRRWIMSDLSKFAIHTTRKRLLDINARPFQLQNLGNYQRHKLKENGIEKYIDFILKLYKAEPVSGYKHIHGKKQNRMVHIGSVDSMVTEREVKEVAQECAEIKATHLDILGWDFEMGLHDLVDLVDEQENVKTKLVQIPREILDIKEEARERIRFFDLNYLDVRHKIKGNKLSITLKKFVIANPEYLPDEVREKIKNFTDYVDYWAVDFDYKEDTFHNMWQSFRTRKHPKLATSYEHSYTKKGKYKVLIKVVDIFGNDTNKLLKVKF